LVGNLVELWAVPTVVKRVALLAAAWVGNWDTRWVGWSAAWTVESKADLTVALLADPKAEW
jgi:hypothetical protein